MRIANILTVIMFAATAHAAAPSSATSVAGSAAPAAKPAPKLKTPAATSSTSVTPSKKPAAVKTPAAGSATVAAASARPTPAKTPAAVSATPAASATVSAAPAATDKIAELSKVSGLVRVMKPGQAIAIAGVQGATLYGGDKVVTERGKAEILFVGGSLMRLNASTEVVIMSPVDPDTRGLKGLFTRLMGGSVRAIVNGLRPDERFEMHSQTAIASVKGTDVFFDGSEATVRDEGDGRPHQLELTFGDKSILIDAGMSGGFSLGGDAINPHPTPADLLKALEDQFDEHLTLPTGGGAGNGGNGQGGGTPGNGNGNGTGNGNGNGNGNVNGGEEGSGNSDLHGDMQDFQDSHELADFTDHNEHLGDQYLGRSVLDRHGYRVEMEQYSRLAASNQIEIMFINQRSEGPNAGRTYMQSDFWFNQDLPADDYEGVRRGLGAAFSDPNVMPTYWEIKEEQKIVAPNGDAMLTRVLLADPKPVFDYVHARDGGGTWAYQPYDYYDGITHFGNDAFQASQIGWAQPLEFSRYLQFGGGSLVPKEHFMYTEYGNVVAGWYAGVVPDQVYPDWAHDTCIQYNPGTPTMWSAGPTVMGNDPDMLDANGNPILMYAYDFHFFDAFQTSFGSPELGNPEFGTGYYEFNVDADGGFILTTHYGDGTHLTERQYLVNDQGQTFNANLIDQILATGNGADLFDAQWNIEYELEFDETPGGALHGIDLLIDPSMFEEGDTTPPPVNPPALECGGC